MIFKELARRLTPGARITVLTGAGVSAASGVPTFRGAGGLWRQFRPEDLATSDAFSRDPRLVWEWYDWRRDLISRCRPNRAHQVLAAWSARFPGFTLITQNVDGLHESAGTNSLIRLHGSIWHVRCSRPCAAGADAWHDAGPPPPGGALRTCPHCGALARPGVVWFGESLDPAVLPLAADRTACDVFFAVGTSAVVYPAAGLLHQARRHGAYTVEINPEATDASGAVHLAIAQPAETALPALDAHLSRSL